MKAQYRIFLAVALAVALGGAAVSAQDEADAGTDPGVNSASRRVVRIAPADETVNTDQTIRRFVRVVSTSGDPGAEDGARVVMVGESEPGTYAYSYGLPRQRGYLGVQLVELTPELREYFGAPTDAGVLISRIADDSPGAQAGLRVGDVLAAIDGDSMATGRDIARRISDCEEGTTVALEIWRDRRPRTLAATIVVRDRPAIDLGRFVLPDLDRLGKAVEIDIDNFPEQVIEIDDEEIHKAVRDLQRKLEDPAMVEKFQALDRNRLDLQQRIQELEERLREMELHLEKLPEN